MHGMACMRTIIAGGLLHSSEDCPYAMCICGLLLTQTCCLAPPVSMWVVCEHANRLNCRCPETLSRAHVQARDSLRPSHRFGRSLPSCSTLPHRCKTILAGMPCVRRAHAWLSDEEVHTKRVLCMQPCVCWTAKVLLTHQLLIQKRRERESFCHLHMLLHLLIDQLQAAAWTPHGLSP